ncbi:MAG: hypothetical protein IT448_02185 [Phycisphaerales bacterium]|nr:hypothetical protein [Phycisphaerales bacterium]
MADRSAWIHRVNNLAWQEKDRFVVTFCLFIHIIFKTMKFYTVENDQFPSFDPAPLMINRQNNWDVIFIFLCLYTPAGVRFRRG